MPFAIPEFWQGVLVTLGVIALVIVILVVVGFISAIIAIARYGSADGSLGSGAPGVGARK